ncbi:MAG: LacI family transcriptional regulator [Thermoanaerobaculia bacterium]|nr:MAG: LacI family transcriptional regulator [Thermoanaerobaculia bacterium]
MAPETTTESPSIRVVARAAGVSVATVSRVLNGTGPVRDETRRRVLDAVEALAYVPHSAARSLSTRRTSSVGVLLPDLHGEFFSELIRGIDLTARRAGYHVLVSGSHSEPAEVEAVLRTLHGRVDGLIVLATGLSGDVRGARLPRRLPIVLLNDPQPRPAHDSIRIDNRGGARSATEHLLELGHRRVAMICGPEDNTDAAERLQGFQEALAARGLAAEPRWLLEGDFREESGHRAGAALAALDPRPTAVLAANDAMAIGCLSALRERGLAVPGDVALAGFDDIPISRFLSPPLTSVRVAIAELGGRAMEQLIHAIERDPATPRHHEVVAATLVVRASTSAPSGAPREPTNAGRDRR